jgi:hypothetical protein
VTIVVKLDLTVLDVMIRHGLDGPDIGRTTSAERD